MPRRRSRKPVQPDLPLSPALQKKVVAEAREAPVAVPLAPDDVDEFLAFLSGGPPDDGTVRLSRQVRACWQGVGTDRHHGNLYVVAAAAVAGRSKRLEHLCGGVTLVGPFADEIHLTSKILARDKRNVAPLQDGKEAIERLISGCRRLGIGLIEVPLLHRPPLELPGLRRAGRQAEAHDRTPERADPRHGGNDEQYAR